MLDHDEAQQTAYALDQLDAAGRAEVEAQLASASEQGDAAHLGRLSELLRESADRDESYQPSASLRKQVESRFAGERRVTPRSRRVRVASWVALAAAACVGLAIVTPLFTPVREQGRRSVGIEQMDSLRSLESELHDYSGDLPPFSRDPVFSRSDGRSLEVIDKSLTMGEGYFESAQADVAFAGKPLAAGGGDIGRGHNSAALPRQIIHRGTLALRVEDFDALVGQIDDLIGQHEAEIAHKNITGSPGSPRNGVWLFRVPASQLEAFSAALGHLGELQSESTNSEDISSVYYDTEARLKTKRMTLDRLREHLKSADKTKDTLMIEEQLDRVTGDVESYQQQMDYYKNQVALATVQLTVNEVSSYVPEETPSLSTRVSRSYYGSIDSLKRTGKSLLMMFVAVGPWLAVLAVPLLVVCLVVRRWRAVKRD
jgi:hypothetical protein